MVRRSFYWNTNGTNFIDVLRSANGNIYYKNAVTNTSTRYFHSKQFSYIHQWLWHILIQSSHEYLFILLIRKLLYLKFIKINCSERNLPCWQNIPNTAMNDPAPVVPSRIWIMDSAELTNRIAMQRYAQIDLTKGCKKYCPYRSVSTVVRK